eukprot:SAG22_NODE_5182_length_1068_cov_1.867905_1_plen_48_part_10
MQAFDDRAWFGAVECLPMLGSRLDVAIAEEHAWSVHLRDTLRADHKTV